MSDSENTTLGSRIAAFFKEKIAPNIPSDDPLPENVVELIPDYGPDDTLLHCSVCESHTFMITGAYRVRCANCSELICDISNMTP